MFLVLMGSYFRFILHIVLYVLFSDDLSSFLQEFHLKCSECVSEPVRFYLTVRHYPDDAEQQEDTQLIQYLNTLCPCDVLSADASLFCSPFCSLQTFSF